MLEHQAQFTDSLDNRSRWPSKAILIRIAGLEACPGLGLLCSSLHSWQPWTMAQIREPRLTRSRLGHTLRVSAAPFARLPSAPGGFSGAYPRACAVCVPLARTLIDTLEGEYAVDARRVFGDRYFKHRIASIAPVEGVQNLGLPPVAPGFSDRLFTAPQIASCVQRSLHAISTGPSRGSPVADTIGF